MELSALPDACQRDSGEDGRGRHFLSAERPSPPQKESGLYARVTQFETQRRLILEELRFSETHGQRGVTRRGFDSSRGFEVQKAPRLGARNQARGGRGGTLRVRPSPSRTRPRRDGDGSAEPALLRLQRALRRLHTDHAGGGLHHFPEKEILVTRTELEYGSGLPGAAARLRREHALAGVVQAHPQSTSSRSRSRRSPRA